MANHTGSGTKADPWVLKTPPGTSEYQMYLDDAARSAGRSSARSAGRS